jgi:hypothetical protein
MIGNTMTIQRRAWKSLQLSPKAAHLAAAVAFIGASIALPLYAGPTELVVVDHRTGLALGGFDPVAYFAERAPTPGREEYEFSYAGAVWRFRNAGNRLAFMADPDVYTPWFGGYDPLGIARGVAVAGNPLIWLIAEDRLYLFYDQQARDRFAKDAGALSATADRNWSAVQHTLAP